MVLVTGATGLLGSHIVVELLKNDFEVRAMIRDEKRKVVVLRLLNYYYPEKANILFNKINWIVGDIEDLMDVKEALIGVEKVVHCAALVSFHRKDFWRLINVNRKGTANMVNFSLEAGVKQFVHVSSTAAIGSDALVNDGIKRESNHWNAGEKVSGYSKKFGVLKKKV
jgi:dihydroflavonol-4-reductase